MLVPAAVSVAPAATPLVASERIIGYDLIRAFAALGVIWVHAGRSQPWNDLDLSAAGAWGTSYLNLIAGFFTVIMLHKHMSAGKGLGSFTRHRLWRIGAPFVIWSGLYLLARLVNYAVFGKVSSFEWTWSALYYGTTYHLWFLPYLLCITLITLPLTAYAVASAERMVMVGKLLLLTVFGLLLMPVTVFSQLPDEWARIAHSVSWRGPGFMLGLAMGMFIAAGYRPKVTFTMVAACAVLAISAMYLSLTTELPKHILNRVAGVSVFIIALAPWRGAIATTIARLGSLGFGVYLCHVLFVEGVVAVFSKAGIGHSLERDVLTFTIVATLSFGFAYAMKRSRKLSWLIP